MRIGKKRGLLIGLLADKHTKDLYMEGGEIIMCLLNKVTSKGMVILIMVGTNKVAR